MKLKINTNLLINVIVIGFVLFMAFFYYIVNYIVTNDVPFGLNSFNSKGNIYNRWNNQLPAINPDISTDLPHSQYLKLKEKARLSRQFKNGTFLGMSGARLSFIGTNGGYLCDTCTMLTGDFSYIPGSKQFYIMLPGWRLKDGYRDQYNLDSVNFFVEHNQSYVRKTVIDTIIKKKDGLNYQLHLADFPVKFRYNKEENALLIPVSESVKNRLTYICLACAIAVVLYFLYLIASFLKFIADLSKGLSFTDVNIRRLRLIAISLLCYPLLTIVLNLLVRFIFHSYFTDDVLFNFDIINNWWNIMGAGIVFLLLFKAFRQGKILKDEQDLTV